MAYHLKFHHTASRYAMLVPPLIRPMRPVRPAHAMTQLLTAQHQQSISSITRGLIFLLILAALIAPFIVIDFSILILGVFEIIAMALIIALFVKGAAGRACGFILLWWLALPVWMLYAPILFIFRVLPWINKWIDHA
jgi:hypothetical protein